MDDLIVNMFFIFSCFGIIVITLAVLLTVDFGIYYFTGKSVMITLENWIFDDRSRRFKR